MMEAIVKAFEMGKTKWDKETKTKIFNDDYKNFNTAVIGFNNYLDYFKDDRNYIKVISTERKFECLIEAENEVELRLLEKLPPIIFTGKIDLCVELDYAKWIFDFKTTGWILDQVISKANRSPQLIGYSYAGEKVLDFKPSGCLCSFAFVGSRKNKAGEYGNVKHDFRRVPQIFTQGDIDAWKLQLIDAAREIHFCTENNLWVESFDSCYNYGACPYLKLCRQHTEYENLNLEGFHTEYWDVLSDDMDG